MNLIVFDTSAWLAYFLDENKGNILESLLNEKTIITPSIILYEIACKGERDGWQTKKYLDFIYANSKVVSLDINPILVGKVLNKMRQKNKSAGVADAIILSTAKEENAKIITKDNHFKGFSETILLNDL